MRGDRTKTAKKGASGKANRQLDARSKAQRSDARVAKRRRAREKRARKA
jgi:hypothetical protein